MLITTLPVRTLVELREDLRVLLETIEEETGGRLPSQLWAIPELPTEQMEKAVRAFSSLLRRGGRREEGLWALLEDILEDLDDQDLLVIQKPGVYYTLDLDTGEVRMA